MKTLLATLVTTTALVLAGAAYANDIDVKTDADYTAKDNGGYESSDSSSRTDAAGTTIKTEKSMDVDVDKDGSSTSTMKIKKKVDPKGLMNGKKSEKEVKTEKNADGSYTRKTTEESKDAAGTNVSTESKVDVEIDGKGNVVTKTETEKTTDPKGLMNSATETVKTKAVNGEVVEHEKDVD